MNRPCRDPHPVPIPDRCPFCWRALYDPDYRKLWGAELVPEGPMPPDPATIARQTARPGLGDMVATALAKMGIQPCGGCAKRKELLNQFGQWASNAIRGEQPRPDDSGAAPLATGERCP